MDDIDIYQLDVFLKGRTCAHEVVFSNLYPHSQYNLQRFTGILVSIFLRDSWSNSRCFRAEVISSDGCLGCVRLNASSYWLGL